jgi:hypothetical protein
MLIPLDDHEALLALRDYDRRAQPPRGGQAAGAPPPEERPPRAA